MAKIKTSLLNLVDLAGSERQRDTRAAGLRLKVSTVQWACLPHYKIEISCLKLIRYALQVDKQLGPSLYRFVHGHHMLPSYEA